MTGFQLWCISMLDDGNIERGCKTLKLPSGENLRPLLGTSVLVRVFLPGLIHATHRVFLESARPHISCNHLNAN